MCDTVLLVLCDRLLKRLVLEVGVFAEIDFQVALDKWTELEGFLIEDCPLRIEV